MKIILFHPPKPLVIITNTRADWLSGLIPNYRHYFKAAFVDDTDHCYFPWLVPAPIGDNLERIPLGLN